MKTMRKPMLLGFLLFVGTLWGQPTSWRRMGTDEGLSNLQTRQIISLPNGRMLVVVEGVIDLYDGAHFQPLELDRTLTADVHSFLNTDHFFDRQGRLWIRTLHQLTVIDVATLRPLDVRQLLRDAGIGGTLQNFFVDGDGVAWMHVGEDSLMRCDWQGPARLVMHITDRNTDGIRSSVCDVVGAGARRYIFFSSGRMVCLEGERVRYTQQVCDASHGYYLRARARGADTIVVRTVEAGEPMVAHYDVGRRCLSDTLLKGHAMDVFFDEMGDFWTFEKRTVWHYDHRLRLKETLDESPVDILDFTPDHQGGGWACSFNRGLFYHAPQTNRLPYEQMPERGAITSFLTDGDGRLWVGSSHGLLRRQGDEWRLLPGTEAWRVSRLTRADGGHIYVSTANTGLLEIDGEGHVVWQIDEQTDPKMRNNVAFGLDLPDGRRLFNTRLNRLIIYDPATDGLDHLMERLPNAVSMFRNIVDCLPLEGGMLMGTQNGLFFLKETDEGGRKDYRIDTERFAALGDNPWSIKCNCLLRDREGRIWVGTQNGLLCYDEGKDELRHYGRADGLPNNCVQSMTEDADGRLWMATLGGLCQLDVKTGETCSFGKAEGMEDGTFVERAALRMGDGTLLFGTEHGLYTLQPDSLRLPDAPLVPQLMGLRIAGREGFVTGTRRIVLPHDQNFLSFILSTLNYAYASHTRYRYQLQGIDPVPILVTGQGDRLELAYTALPPGRYVLEVQASMQGGEWGQPMRFEIVIRPPLWRTWWAYLIYVLLALGTGYYIRRSYLERRQMHQRINELLREKDLFLQNQHEEEESEEAEEAPKEQQEISPADRRFLEKALGCIDRNMDNAEYTIDDFASDMAMERSTLYRKLQAVMGQGPLEFVRTIRLKRAAELLRSGKYNVTEVSELVGFNTPRYFTKHFREMYGVRPSEYR